MKMTFRWYGEDDPVTLAYCRLMMGFRHIAVCEMQII